MQTENRGHNAEPGMRDVPRILYAEDDSDLQFLVSACLGEAGYQVLAAENGIRAWEFLRSETFDLLVTDNQMPELTGVELVRRARLTGMRLPIIVTTGNPELISESRRRLLRIDAILIKPFRPEELVRAIEEALGLFRLGHCDRSVPCGLPLGSVPEFAGSPGKASECCVSEVRFLD